MDKLKLAEQALIKEDTPEFRSGDRVNVHYRVREGEKERIQQFEGDVIARHGSGANKTFMVRKVSAGNIGVERIFPLNSPFIAKIEVVKEGDVSRSKLYYLRERSGKSARIKEKDTRFKEVEEEIAAKNQATGDENSDESKQSPPDEKVATNTAAQDTDTKKEAAENTNKEEAVKDQPAVNEKEQSTADESDEKSETADVKSSPAKDSEGGLDTAETEEEQKKKKQTVSEEE